MTGFFNEHFFGKFEDSVAEPRKPMLTLSNLLPRDFIFPLFPELDVFIDSGLNVAVELSVYLKRCPALQKRNK